MNGKGVLAGLTNVSDVQMCIRDRYYITTAIAYTSGKPHIGNTYEFVLADAIARYKRSKGYDVYFQTGTDEHGQKIELKAEEAGITPKEYVDKVCLLYTSHGGFDFQVGRSP